MNSSGKKILMQVNLKWEKREIQDWKSFTLHMGFQVNIDR
jgi:hypothetical protein